MTTAFNNAWVGYDLPFSEIESQPEVAALRAQGLKKRVQSPEHHVTVGYFKNINLPDLEATIRELETTTGSAVDADVISFDGMGEISGPDGRYVFFTPAVVPNRPLVRLRTKLEQTLLAGQTVSGLHLSVGGPDPFGGSKERQQPLAHPFEAAGQLVFVGNDGKQFQKLYWNSKQHAFVAPTGEAPVAPASTQPAATTSKTPLPVHTVAIFPKIQADTAVAVYLLARFGKDAFPGIDQMKLEFWTALPSGETPEGLQAKGILPIDLGGGLFDHHLANQASGKREDCASTLIAKHLGIDNNGSLRKVLAWAKRDDLEGKGTVSVDPLDRAFGLSGIIMTLNRAFPSDPKRVIDHVVPLIHYHVMDEQKRTEELPKEWDELQAVGKGKIFKLRQGSADLKAAFVESDNTALPGFLRAAKRMDLIVQRRTSGHTNVMTRQERSLDLRPVIAALRLKEAERKGVTLPADQTKWQSTGRLDPIDEWYYDDAANTLQNGGISPGDIPATKLTADEVIAILTATIPKGVIGALKRTKERELGATAKPQPSASV